MVIGRCEAIFGGWPPTGNLELPKAQVVRYLRYLVVNQLVHHLGTVGTYLGSSTSRLEKGNYSRNCRTRYLLPTVL